MEKCIKLQLLRRRILFNNSFEFIQLLNSFKEGASLTAVGNVFQSFGGENANGPV